MDTIEFLKNLSEPRSYDIYPCIHSIVILKLAYVVYPMQIHKVFEFAIGRSEVASVLKIGFAHGCYPPVSVLLRLVIQVR